MIRTSPTDLRPARRVATAFCVVAVPILVGALTALVPSVGDGNGRQVFAAFHAHLGEARAELAVSVAATLVLPFFVLGLYRLSVRGAPVLSGVGCVLALVGWEALAFVSAGDALMYELAARGGSPTIWSHFMANPAIVVMTLIFVVGHLAGTAMLGIALWRVLAVRLWAASAIVAGDFGRTPGISYAADSSSGVTQPGRDHWPHAMSFLFSGGGIAGGQVIGATDRRGEHATDRRVGVGDFLATVYRHLGIDAEQVEIRDSTGRPIPFSVKESRFQNSLPGTVKGRRTSLCRPERGCCMTAFQTIVQ